MSMSMTRKMKYALVGAMVAAVCALCALPGMAFAATNVTVNYEDAYGDAHRAVVDLDTLATNNTYNYMFQKNGVNNVIKADKTVSLDAVVTAALTVNGDQDDKDTIWTSGKALTFTTDGGAAYTKYTQFTYDRLTAQNLFFPATFSTGAPVGVGSPAPAVLALSSGAAAMNSADQTKTAQQVSDTIATSTTTSPRLLWGWPTATPGADQLGGNRYPSNIESITIS